MEAPAAPPPPAAALPSVYPVEEAQPADAPEEAQPVDAAEEAQPIDPDEEAQGWKAIREKIGGLFKSFSGP